MNIKQNVRIKIRQRSLDIFSNQILLESIDYLFYFIQIKVLLLKDLKLKGIIDNYNVIINGKNFYDQAIDSDIKRYKEIRKLITGQDECYNTGCLFK